MSHANWISVLASPPCDRSADSLVRAPKNSQRADKAVRAPAARFARRQCAAPGTLIKIVKPAKFGMALAGISSMINVMKPFKSHALSVLGAFLVSGAAPAVLADAKP